MITTGIDTDHMKYFDVGLPSHFPIPTYVKVKLPLMIKQYKLVSGSDQKKVTAEVNMYLSEGWALYGNINVVAGPSHSHFIYTQGLVKDELQVEN